MDTQTKKSGMGKKSIIIIAFLILVLVVIIASQKKSMAPTNTLNQAPAPTTAPTGNQQSAVQPPNDKMASINQDLQGVNLTDLENEFKDIDANLKNL